MEAKRHNRKIDNHDDDRSEVSSLRPPSRESSHDNSFLQSRNERRPQEHNPQTRMQGTTRLLTGSSNTACNQSVEQEDLKVPGHIHIDDEEEEKQDIVTSLPVREGDREEQQQMCPGAVAVHGPGFESSEQSTAGTILVGDQFPVQNHGTPFISNEPSARENQNLVIAAVVAPTEADEVARIDNEIERRVRDQFDRFLQQTPRAETVILEISANDDLNESVEEAAALREGVDVGATNEMANANISNMTQVALHKTHEGKEQTKEGSYCMCLDTARKKRLVCLILILTVIVIIAVGITIAVFLSKSSGEGSLQCGSTSPCNLDHADASCANGQCVIDKCESNYEDCNTDTNDGCEVNLQTDKDHCSSCNNLCDLPNANSKCVAQQCLIENCSVGFGDCDNKHATGCETNLQSDKNNCGSCSNICDLPNGISKCVEGECVLDNCTDGYASCDDESTNSCEVNLQTDKNNCGSCNNMCDLPHANSKCVELQCLIESCSVGFGDCDSKQVTGCETNLQTDKNNCGSCANACDLLNFDHADAICTNGQCMIDKCELNYGDCNTDAHDGCEVNLQTDKNHCGSCNNKCDLPHANSKCVGLQCSIESCSVGFGNCDGKSVTGCETNLQSDKNNCGSCANKCNLPNGISKCVEGECVLDNCIYDHASCDDKSPNSCEVNLQTDENHCGFCGNRCDLSNANSRCVEGLCTVDTCVPGYDDCDGKASTGCETDLLSNEDHCGSCNNECSTGDSCTNGACVTINVQRSALMSLYESTNGPNWDTDAQTNWGLPNVTECGWEGVTCTNGKVTQLDKIDCNMKGTISTDVGLLTELTYLDLDRNQLTGTLPFEMTRLTKLIEFYLSHNELTGTIEMGRLTNMEEIMLQHNIFTGTLPSDMASLTRLRHLYLHDNELTGTIPTEMGRLTDMKEMSFSTNKFTGTLPSEIASMTKLTSLWVYNNTLASIPTEICNMDVSTFWGDCPPCSLGCCTYCY